MTQKRFQSTLIFVFFCLFFCIGSKLDAQMVPGKHWLQYAAPEAAGFSKDSLASLKNAFESNGGAALLVAYRGKIVLDWGTSDRRFPQASVRKSYLSALVGRYAAKGKINIQKTLGELGIDDLNKLTDVEKQAKVIDLLAARSGIYLPAAFMPRGMKESMPQRGSHAPGTFWYYNNWDFNALVTIFNRQTGQDFFETFSNDIAQPIGMEDFRLFDTYYLHEKDKSEHPAYIFKLSARDMARFGLLYLNKGRWNGNQIIPEAWIRQSTAVYTSDLGANFSDRNAYGLLWWVSAGIAGRPMYYASGAGGQRINVFPEDDLVVVHLTDTYSNKEVSDHAIDALLERLIRARTAKPAKKPKLKAYAPASIPIPKMQPAALPLAEYAGAYRHARLGQMLVSAGNDHLTLEVRIGRFKMYPVGEHRFWVEDQDITCTFEKGDAAQKGQVVAELGDRKEIRRVVFYY